jgi:hypothetical protein
VKHYIGDGVYVKYDGFALWLTTENGLATTNRICLEPDVLKAFLEYLQDWKADKA